MSSNIATAWKIITDERNRQITEKGFSSDHDDRYTEQQLFDAGLCYLNSADGRHIDDDTDNNLFYWPWDQQWWKPDGRLSDLKKAGALFLAERDRRVRAKLSTRKVDVLLGKTLERLVALVSEEEVRYEKPPTKDSEWIGPYTASSEAIDQLRRAVAVQIGADPETWPDHKNAPLAISAVVALTRTDLEMTLAAKKTNDESQIKSMAERFLSWKLPDDFCPDGGIVFTKVANKGTDAEYTRAPIGTNLFSYEQAVAMVKYMFEGISEK